MNGEIDFTESLRQRVALLEGVPSDVFEKLKSVITFTPGARELTRALKTLGFKLAVLSGGFMPLANYVKEELGLDYAHANTVFFLISLHLSKMNPGGFSLLSGNTARH